MDASLPQATLGRPFSAAGAGLHLGRRATVTAHPAPPDSGIAFVLTAGARSAPVRADWRNRIASRMNTALRFPDGRTLRTIEHLLASLAAHGIDNALVEVDGAELPIFDGSARRWCALIAGAGIASQPAPRRVIRVLAPVQVRHGASFIRAEPAGRLELDVTTDQFPAFGTLAWRGAISPATFTAELSVSRSFGALGAHWATVLFGGARRDRLGAAAPVRAGREPNSPAPSGPDRLPDHLLAAFAPPPGETALRGAWPGRVAVIVGRHILGGARLPDEPARHKALDLLGDLMLAGAPICARVVAHRPTHALAWALAATLMGQPEAWCWDSDATRSG